MKGSHRDNMPGNTATGPVLLNEIPARSIPRDTSASEQKTIDAIKSTLNFYASCIGGRDLSSLSHVFSLDAIINWGPPMGETKGIQAIIRSIQRTIGNLLTHNMHIV